MIKQSSATQIYLCNSKFSDGISCLLSKNYCGGNYVFIRRFHFVMDDTSVPYEPGDNPFRLADDDIAFMNLLVENTGLKLKWRKFS